MIEAQTRGLGLYTRQGFYLQHDGDMTVSLLHEGELVGRFSQTGATEQSLQAECSKHLVMNHPG